ncbi:hypothetical protein B4U79_17801 [Dinothrombium tinctorium]|uniref:C2H2-type domain-containing protein n=1 Tax=Dinothrombium tinctorium TaxID=1965070 RepID=A0A3S5WGR5_9ACAR|nr:hypothetical protein B4U79_16154 [Dinothrombium tinctorium]RWS07141.1 hypothetical protein B4U79_16153 [Dinothrombium tinctorium]RWS08145.1 hypothetical protein B4U79_17806 [Dinothrombium tinctorium]RWS08170.1 hypothetical protein B4U79_17801 [Dinothrombium tinctorium]
MSLATEMLLNEKPSTIKKWLNPYASDDSDAIFDKSLLQTPQAQTSSEELSVEVQKDDEYNDIIWLPKLSEVLDLIEVYITHKSSKLIELKEKRIHASTTNTQNAYSNLLNSFDEIQRRFRSFKSFSEAVKTFETDLKKVDQLLSREIVLKREMLEKIERQGSILKTRDPIDVNQRFLNNNCKKTYSNKASVVSLLSSRLRSASLQITPAKSSTLSSETEVEQNEHSNGSSSSGEVNLNDPEKETIVRKRKKGFNEERRKLHFIYQCPKCTLKFIDSVVLEKHLKTHVTNEVSIIQTINSSSATINTEDKKRLNFIYQCPKCSLKFIDASVLENHLKIHTTVESKTAATTVTSSSDSHDVISNPRPAPTVNDSPKNKGVTYIDCAICSRIMLMSTIDDKVNRKYGKLCCITCNNFFTDFTLRPTNDEYQHCKGPAQCVISKLVSSSSKSEDDPNSNAVSSFDSKSKSNLGTTLLATELSASEITKLTLSHSRAISATNNENSIQSDVTKQEKSDDADGQISKTSEDSFPVTIKQEHCEIEEPSSYTCDTNMLEGACGPFVYLTPLPFSN